MAPKEIRIPPVRTLYQMLPKGAEGGKEFARLMDLLLFHEGRRTGKKIRLFSDVAGDYHGLDSFSGDTFRKEGTTGYQYKFYPSPLSDTHRKSILESLERTAKSQAQLKLKKWVLVTPENLIESSRRKDGGDVTWFEGLRKKLNLKFELAHWGHQDIIALFIDTPTVSLFYYPELVPEGAIRRKTIQETRVRYDENLIKLYRDIQFVGMNVRKQEATKGVPMEHIYIPLTVIPEAADEQDRSIVRTDPRLLLSRDARHVILGDPGSGKSTLLRFLTLIGISEPLRQRYESEPDDRLPIFVTLRRYADELKTRPNLALIKYIQETIQSDFNLNSADQEFFDFYLDSGQAVLFFDGLDELPGSHFKEKVRDQIRTLVTTYPGNSAVVTSRIVGYDNPFRFDEKEFTHHRLTRLRLPEMKQFVEDWYAVRIENERDRADHVRSLVRILENPEQKAIYDLAENPLLLTIIALVHRIDGVLPDARVVLYKICTETLLESWHRWKFKELETKNRGREERRNKQRMEAIAHWMQTRSVGTGKTQRAVVPFTDLKKFLTGYIKDNEKLSDPNDEPQDLADEFLRFVKERAGLLVELGDNEYSFVHLTFQEYLTASYIKTNSELEGISKTWETIKKICFESRWHEVVRLLIAGLDSNASQQFLIEQLISQKANGQQSSKAQLLGGLLLDGIEAAEERTRDILRELIESSMDAGEIEQVRQTNTLLNLWLTKESSNQDFLCDVFEEIKADLKGKDQGLRLTLVGTAIGMPKEKQLEFAANLLDSDSVEAELFVLLFGPEPMTEVSPRLLQRLMPLWTAQYSYTRWSPQPNFIAAACEAVSGFLSADIAAKHLFGLQLYSFDGSPAFSHLMFNLCRFMQNAAAITKVTSLISFRDSSPQFYGMYTTLLRLQLHVEPPVMNIDVNYDYPDSEFLLETGTYTPVFTTICEHLKLEPRSQWFEALRVDFLPRFKYRLPLLSGNKWEKIEASFNNGAISAGDEFLAAWLVIFDAWLYLLRAYDSADNSPFVGLLALTRNSTAPALKVAHYFRDQVFGDGLPNDDFLPTLQSLDSTLQEIGLALLPEYPITRHSKKPSKKSSKIQSKKPSKKK
jgi:hypothetical protein